MRLLPAARAMVARDRAEEEVLTPRRSAEALEISLRDRFWAAKPPVIGE